MDNLYNVAVKIGIDSVSVKVVDNTTNNITNNIQQPYSGDIATPIYNIMDEILYDLPSYDLIVDGADINMAKSTEVALAGHLKDMYSLVSASGGCGTQMGCAGCSVVGCGSVDMMNNDF